MRPSPVRLAALCLTLTAGALSGCDDPGATDDRATVEACGMPLRGPGVHTVARYDDGFLLTANPTTALIEHPRGYVWRRLDGSASGRIDLTADPLDGQTVSLYGPDHLVVSGWGGGWDPVLRVRRLSTDEVIFDGEGTLAGDWIFDGSRMISLSGTRQWQVGCESCVLRAIDGVGRAWFSDGAARRAITLDLASGAEAIVPNIEPRSIHRSGLGVVADHDAGGRILFGRPGVKRTCSGWNAQLNDQGAMLCLGNDGVRNEAMVPLTVWDATGAEVAAVMIPRPWQIRGHGDGFITSGSDRIGLLTTTWISARDGSTDSRSGSPLIWTGAVIMESADRVLVIDPSGRFIPLDGVDGLVGAPVVSSDGRYGVVTDSAGRGLFDLRTGERLRVVPAGGWLRFAGDVLLRDGAPLGQTPPPHLTNIIFADRDCPATVMEQCIGTDCVLAVVEY